MDIASENYKFFKEHLADLIKDHYNQYVVIKDQQVLNTYSTFDEAYNETIKIAEVGSFIIQHCVNPGEDAAYFAAGNVYFPHKVVMA
ncbi:MAG: hypothetical protein LBJ25_01205 [Candidatus Margulisbacteria bacterium]|jgi:hypothetical protein|nr:hypothetical protein [Candidatus Margulisiibacteriota bacterium]